MSQRHNTLNYLQTFGHITPLAAREVFGIQRLAARVDELRQNLEVIDTVTVTDLADHPYTRYVYTGVNEHTGVGFERGERVSFERGADAARRRRYLAYCSVGANPKNFGRGIRQTRTTDL